MAKKSNEKKLVMLTPYEIKDVVKSFMITNKQLQEKGKQPNAVAFVAEAGIGKTSAVIQAAEERNAGFAKVSLSNLDDLGDLVGFPVKTYQVELKDTKEKQWVDDTRYNLMLRLGHQPTGEVRTDYAPPKWVTLLSKEENILLLDDFSRADQRFMQAIMELIDRQEYYGWKLPKGTTIVLTGNPAGEDYFVAEQDAAQSTRYFEYGVKFDIESWAKHAEEEELDGRCINFLLRFWREVIGTDTKLKSNPRQWMKFFNKISFYPNFNASLAEIQRDGRGIIGDHVNQFVQFINFKLDELMQPDEMLLSKHRDLVLQKIKKSIGSFENKDYRPEVASILATRFVNYSIKYFEDHPLTDELADRFEDLCKERVFGEDLTFKIFKDNFGANKQKFKKLFQRPFFIKHLI